MEIVDLLQFSQREQLRRWLESHNASARECWVVSYRGRTKPEWDALPYLTIVEEALCFGWIDSTNKRLPDGRLAQRLSPRRPGSHWTDLNRQRCHQLEQAGLMTPAGRQALIEGETKQ